MAHTIAKTSTGIRKLNTRIWNDNGHFMVQLYETVVYDEGYDTITLNNGGYVTPTTVSRMVQALRHRGHDVRVNIKNGEMVWQSPCGNPQKFVDGKAVIKKVA